MSGLGYSNADSTQVWLRPVDYCTLMTAYQPVTDQYSCVALHSTVETFTRQSLVKNLVKSLAEA